jgi:hypothetical protein
MPSKSKKQHNLMAAVANNPKFAKKVGIPQSVGEDYVEADKGRKLRSGGMAGCGTKRMSKGGMSMAAGKGYRRGGKTEIEPKMTTYKSRVKPLPLQPSRLEPRPEPRPIQPPMPRPEPRPEPRPTGNQNPLPQTQPPPRGYKAGGKVRGAGMCKKGVRPCKMV